ncbi:MAG TPA: sugar phosphate nucleotidyltransferase [Spirochaetota bacterium]|nr:sugar phosphate nucleotidyltransferase [Spirochaetota bacterium]HOM38128.1 sugar phosphate nucleotidyltransferase [Spirochaetota bacterium]HPQ48930.1 sugar phosphate nucleotidyltransferase [Spirochaetota bacterium]
MDVKGVIIAAGYGTRLLPFTKSISKELIPLGTTPAIDFILREFINAGIKDVIIVTSRQKRDLENYLDVNFELEKFLDSKNKKQEIESIKPYDMNFFFVRQKYMKGTGDALLITEPFLKNSVFVVAFPDDIDPTLNLSKKMIETYKEKRMNVLAGFEVDKKDVSKYGIIKPDNNNTVLSIIEKPSINEAPSNIASMGRYLFTDQIFEKLKEALKFSPPEREFFMTDGIELLAKENKVCFVMADKRLDTGSYDSYINSFLEILFTERKDIFINFLKEKGIK